MSESLVWEHVDRHRLVRLCALVSGSWAAAEDLAQETLLEAHRNAHKLVDPSGAESWLNAIARNVCRRWTRREAAHAARHDRLRPSADLADTFDLEVELEREELARLLDRALALLPAETRQVLVGRYVDERSPTQIAEVMGLSPDAVSMRISRGKLMLRRVLETDLRRDAEAFGFLRLSDSTWRTTSLWCAQCGEGRLSLSTATTDGSMSFRCLTCFPQEPVLTSHYPMSNPCFARLLGPVARPTAIVARASTWVHDYFVAAIHTGRADCTRCGRPTPLRRYVRAEPFPSASESRGVYVHCEACAEEATCSMGGLALSLPEVRRFRRSHPRLKALPVHHVERAGRLTAVVGFADTATRDRVDVLLDDATLLVHGVHPTVTA